MTSRRWGGAIGAAMLEIARLGPALRLLRRHRNLRQYEVAEAAGLTAAMVSAYERGGRRPSVGSLVRVLNALDADFAVLQSAYRRVQRSS